jgi:hypothetical protein
MKTWMLVWLLCLGAPLLAGDVYFESFDHGSGGWFSNRREPLPIWDGIAYCYGPWYLDSHHAPPGAGYLHMLMYLYTTQNRSPEGAGNRFVEQKKSTNLTNARLSARLRGEMDPQGAQLVVLVQGRTPKTTANFALTGQPFRITHDWSEQSVTIEPNPAQWTCLGARWNDKHGYGCDDIATVLKDVNIDIMFVLFPLRIVPWGRVADPNKLRPGEDYPEEPSYPVRIRALPKGLLMFDWVKIEYPNR